MSSVHVDVIPDAVTQTVVWFASDDDRLPPDITQVRAAVGLGLLYGVAINWTIALLDPHKDPETRRLMRALSRSLITHKGCAALISLAEQRQMPLPDPSCWTFRCVLSSAEQLTEATPSNLTESPCPAPPAANGQGPAPLLALEPGSFLLCGKKYPLAGKPREVLGELIRSRNHICTAAELLDTVWRESDVGQGTVRSAVSTARKTLRDAMREQGIEQPEDPIRTVDRGIKNLAWELMLL
jgi:hypothetical protein